MLRNRFSNLEIAINLLSVVAVSGAFRCYRVDGAFGSQIRWLTIPRSGFQLVLSFFLLDLARNGREAYSRSTMGCRRWGFVSVLAVKSLTFTKFGFKTLISLPLMSKFPPPPPMTSQLSWNVFYSFFMSLCSDL